MKSRLARGLALGLIAVGACTAREQAPQPDAALTVRIEQLVARLIANPDDAATNGVLADARAIFEREGVPGVAKVGDAAAYGFVFVNMLAQPPEFRRAFFARIQDPATRRDLPPDALLFADARIRQTDVEDRYKDRTPDQPKLRDEISHLIRDDQAVRERAGFDFQKMEQADRKTAGPLKAILDRVGVPTYDMVGVQAAKDFIVMVQHQPADFRAIVLPKLKANVDAGQADPASYATVYDRTQADQQKKQLYGQNFVCGASKTMEPAPLDQPDRVDTRRAELGLMRLGFYARLLRAHSPDMCKTS